MTTDEKRANPPLRRRAAAIFALATLCAGVCLSCSDDPTADVTTRCIDFVPAEGSASGNVIARKSAESSCNFLVLDLVVTDVSDIFSTEITVEYPNALALIFSLEVGPLLLFRPEDDDGSSSACSTALADHAVYCMASSDFDQGTVDVSISRTNPDWNSETADAGSDGAVLATLTFSQLTLVSGANGPMAYLYGKLLNAEMPPDAIIDIDPNASPAPLTSGTFLGGQLVIVDQ